MRRILAVCLFVATVFAFVPGGPAAAVGEPLTGTVRASGSPVSFATVTLTSTVPPNTTYITMTGVSGAYAITAPDGGYTLAASAPGYFPNPAIPVTINTATPQQQDLFLLGFGPPPPPPPPSVPITITGRLVDDLGNGTNGTVTSVLSNPFPTTPPPPVTVPSDGNFSVVLPAGSWRVTAGGPGRQPVTFDNVTTSRDLGNITLLPGATVTGVVTNSAGAPIAGAEVRAFKSGVFAIAGPVFTDAQGRYTLALGAAGDWSVQARAAGYATEGLVPASSYPIGVTTKDVVLRRNGTLTGTVYDPQGNPLVGIFIGLSGAEARSTQTDANGAFSFTLPPGSYSLSVLSSTLYRPVALPVAISEDATVTQDVRLRDASTVTLKTSAGPFTSPPSNDVLIVGCAPPGIPSFEATDQCVGGAPGARITFLGAPNADGVAPLNGPPGTYNVATVVIDLSRPGGAVVQPGVLTITLSDDQALTCTLYVDASSASSCTGGTPPDTDGIDPAAENGAPNDGDGNGDGTADSTQSHVASTPDPTGGYVTIAAASDQFPLSNVTAVDPASLASAPPAGVTGQSALVGFQIELPTGVGTATIDVYLDDPAGDIDSYWKYNGTTWIDATSLATFAPASGGRTKATLTLTDGGLGDQDGVVNGSIVDPGLFTARGPYTVRMFSPILTVGLRSAKSGTTVPFLFQVRDAQGRRVTLPVVSAPTSHKVRCPSGTPLPLRSLGFLPATTSTSGGGNWYAGWRATNGMKGTCQAVTIRLDDGTALRSVIKVI